MPIPPALQLKIEELRADHASGATVLAKQAANAFLQLIDPQMDIANADLASSCTDLAYAVVRSQPTMAPLVNLGNRMLLTVRQSEHPDELRDRIRSLAGGMISQLDTSTTRIALHAELIIGNGMTILTLSNSSAVKKALVKAKDAGRSFSVICTESRPMLEGVDLSRELAAYGIPVTLIADAAAFSVMHEAHAVLVGADSVSPGGVVNKIGTSGLALAARTLKIPFHVLCGSEKFIPDRLVMIEQTKSVQELLSVPVPNVSVRNVYFDTTPLDHLTNLITEEGIQEISNVRMALSALEKDFLLKPSDLSPAV